MIKFFFDGKHGRALMCDTTDFPSAVMFETEDDFRLIKSFSGRIRAHAEALREMIYPECRPAAFPWRQLSSTGPDLTIIREIISAINHCKSPQTAPDIDLLTASSRPLWQLPHYTEHSLQEIIPTPIYLPKQ